jgi:hypothetical protein
MEIICTKDEFARLIRWCECAKYEKMCDVCPFVQCDGEDCDRDELSNMCRIVCDPDKE